MTPVIELKTILDPKTKTICLLFQNRFTLNLTRQMYFKLKWSVIKTKEMSFLLIFYGFSCLF